MCVCVCEGMRGRERERKREERRERGEGRRNGLCGWMAYVGFAHVSLCCTAGPTSCCWLKIFKRCSA